VNNLQLKIKNIPEVAPDKIDMQMINNFDDEEEGNAVSWEEYKAERKARAYSGNISLRIPKDLHRELVGVAKEQGVSLNQYCLYKLAR
jgi:predicted HicB family RNase H-like nuclease